MKMQVTETLADGLKRELKIVIPANDMEARMNERLADVKDKVRVKGFRPGKVPISHLKKVYGKSIMAELVNEIIREKPTELLSERGEKAAMQPEISMTEDEAEANEILAAKADFSFSVSYEIIPPIEIKDLSAISVERQVVAIPDADVEEQVMRIAENARSYTTKDGAAETGDRITMDFVGKIDGEAFEGGSAEDSNLVLGSNQFIAGFEEQLIGVKAGEEKSVTVTFPDDYQEESLAGKQAVFDVTIKDVSAADELVIDDELAKKLGLESIERLREIVREQIESQFGQITRQKLKRQILDQLDGLYTFEAPSKLIEGEFNNIWGQITRDLEVNEKTFEDEETTEEKAREDYQKLAERRVRLGLVLAEIGEKAGVTVSDDELQKALFEQVRQYPGQEKQIYDYFRNTPGAIATLRAPIFEEKTIDHLLEQISVTDKTVTKEELMADDEADDDPLSVSGVRKQASGEKAEGSQEEEKQTAQT